MHRENPAELCSAWAGQRPAPTQLSLFLFHGVDKGVELTSVDYLYEGFAVGFVADHVDRRRVLKVKAVAEIAVGGDLGGKFALGVDYEREGEFVVGGEFFGEGMEIVFSDFELVGEALVAKFVADFFGVGVEIAGEDRGFEGPLVEGQREVVADYRDAVGFGGFFEERGGAGAVGAFEIFEDHDGDLGSFGGFEDGGGGVLGCGVEGEQGKYYCYQGCWFDHNF